MIREQMAIELWYLGIPPAQRVAVKDKDALWQSFHPSTQQRYVTDAIKLASLLCAEIEKMGLSDVEIAEFAVVCWAALEPHERHSFKQVAQAQLQKILKELGGAE